MKKLYIDIGKPIQTAYFTEYNKPFGWFSVDYIKIKLEDYKFLKLFNDNEIYLLKQIIKRGKGL